MESIAHAAGSRSPRAGWSGGDLMVLANAVIIFISRYFRFKIQPRNMFLPKYGVAVLPICDTL
jgi:hypothetical protein